MLKSSLCDYRDAYILVSGTVTVAVLAAGWRNKGQNLIFKNCYPFTEYALFTIYYAIKVKNTQVNNAKVIDIVMAMYNLKEYADNYLNAPGRLWQYYRDELPLNKASDFVDFTGADCTVTADFTGANHKSKSFKYKQK